VSFTIAEKAKWRGQIEEKSLHIDTPRNRPADHFRLYFGEQ
jgi:hypothetical protein